ncbi:hypothetical protein [Leucobacter sp. 7(1)]|uniref:hypothetical protein n=1 Tax=Leucobacter sp. 7(1) TaxID=1255613 RepID=UPI000B357992|nr:hypothetical protein [Leucobacter sp. 7(1)]
MTGKLELAPDPGGREGRYRVAYPAGTGELSVSGGLFVRNGGTSLSVAGSGSSARYVDVSEGERQITVNGSWLASGTRGWEPVLDIYNTSTASGGVGQRLAVATGESTGKDLRGRFDAVAVKVPPPFADPQAVTQAQPSADVGGTMRDTLVVSEAPDTRARLWPEAVADFTAYLMPEVGAPKYGENWEPLFAAAEPVSAQAESVQPRENEPPSDHQVPGTPLDRQNVEEAEGAEEAEHAEALRWTAAELESMSAGERCVAQPVYRQGGIPIPGLGEYQTAEVSVRSPGTINWVERIVSQGRTVHEGTCGVPNERTVTEQPGVVTQAAPQAMIGELLTDTATVTGRFSPNAQYSLRFEAYRAEESVEGVPLCTAENRIYRSESIPVSEPGDVVAPGFVARWEHGTKVWWVETLSIDTGSGPERLHRGTCGLDTETTEIGRPEVATVAPETAVVGDVIRDTALVTGDLTETEHARWELTFAGYRGSEDATTPVCTAGNLLFETGSTPVTEPGAVESEAVFVPVGWAGPVWWVETLWLIEGDTRTPVIQGDCGATQERTLVTEPGVATRASTVVATGEAIRDVAEVTGDLTQREDASHDVVFEGYRGDARLTGTDAAQCVTDNALFRTEPVPVTASGEIESSEVTALPEFGDTVWWVAVLRLHVDGATSELVRGVCGAPEETTTVQTPHVRTESAGTIALGSEMYDTAIVEGRFADRPEVSYRVWFTAYAADADGTLTCTPDRVIPALSDLEGVAVDGPGRYVSRRVTATPELVGVGGFVETLVMRESGKDHVMSVGECGAASERFEVLAAVVPDAPPLARTGGPGPAVFLWGSAGLLLMALAAGVAVLARRRRERRILGGTVQSAAPMQSVPTKFID